MTDAESEASRGNVLVGGTGSSDLRWWRAILCTHLCAERLRTGFGRVFPHLTCTTKPFVISVVMKNKRKQSTQSPTQRKKKQGSTQSPTEEPPQNTPATATTSRFNPTPSNTATEQQVQQSLEPLPTTSLIGSAEKSEVVMPMGGQSFLY